MRQNCSTSVALTLKTDFRKMILYGPLVKMVPAVRLIWEQSDSHNPFLSVSTKSTLLTIFQTNPWLLFHFPQTYIHEHISENYVQNINKKKMTI